MTRDNGELLADLARAEGWDARAVPDGGEALAEARRVLSENAGSHFDPELVGDLLAAQEELQDVNQQDEAAA